MTVPSFLCNRVLYMLVPSLRNYPPVAVEKDCVIFFTQPSSNSHHNLHDCIYQTPTENQCALFFGHESRMPTFCDSVLCTLFVQCSSNRPSNSLLPLLLPRLGLQVRQNNPMTLHYCDPTGSGFLKFPFWPCTFFYR